MSKRIMVVEDQEDNRQILRDLLGSNGYDLIEAWDGETALTTLASQRPDLILMDIQLPGIDGYEVTRRIKADPATRDPDHRGHVLCARRRCREGVRSRLRRLRQQALQSAPAPGEGSVSTCPWPPRRGDRGPVLPARSAPGQNANNSN
jgi:CheY-like chemotaxis protein